MKYRKRALGLLAAVAIGVASLTGASAATAATGSIKRATQDSSGALTDISAATAPTDIINLADTPSMVGYPSVEVTTVGRTIAVGDEVTIELPGSTTPAVVNIADFPSDLFRGDGQPILSTQADGSTLSSFATEDGVQTLISIASAAAPTVYRFPLGLPEGGQAVVFDDGSVALVGADGYTGGGFRAPWAFDATGAPVKTSFQIDGNDLVQTVVVTPDTVFPVTADPDLGFEWWGYYVQLTRAETKQVAQIIANNQGPGVLAGVICGALPAPPAVVACGVAIVLVYFRIIDPLSRANTAGKCAAINYPWVALSNPQLGWTTINVTTVNCRR